MASTAFSKEWMEKFMEEWNNDAELTGPLAAINFNSIICYGFKENSTPTGFIAVEQGRAVRAGTFEELNGAAYNWDLRASPERWQKWFDTGMTMSRMGSSYMTGKIKFAKGDYTSMIGNPRMAGPFIKSFVTMGKVKV